MTMKSDGTMKIISSWNVSFIFSVECNRMKLYILSNPFLFAHFWTSQRNFWTFLMLCFIQHSILMNLFFQPDELTFVGQFVFMQRTQSPFPCSSWFGVCALMWFTFASPVHKSSDYEIYFWVFRFFLFLTIGGNRSILIFSRDANSIINFLPGSAEK